MIEVKCVDNEWLHCCVVGKSGKGIGTWKSVELLLSFSTARIIRFTLERRVLLMLS